VVREHLDDARRPVKRRGRPHEHQLGAGGHEPVDQILGQPRSICAAVAGERSRRSSRG